MDGTNGLSEQVKIEKEELGAKTDGWTWSEHTDRMEQSGNAEATERIENMEHRIVQGLRHQQHSSCKNSVDLITAHTIMLIL